MSDEEIAGVSKLVRGYFRRHLRVDDVDDAVQDVLLGLLSAPGPIRSLNAYAIVAARHWRYGAIRVALRHPMEPLPDEMFLPSGDDPHAAAEAAERRRYLQRLFAGFSPLHRALLQRFYLDGQPADAICAELGVSLSKFKTEKFRAKLRLQSRFAARSAA